MALNDAPDRGVVNSVIAVNDAIAKAHDAREFVDALSRIGISYRQTSQCFSDNLKLALYCPAELSIGFIISDAPARTPIPNTARGL